MKAFPNPLTPEEEQHYLKLLREGDKAAKDLLIERNMRLVAHVVKKYCNASGGGGNSAERDMEDLISIGTIGLIKAVNTFKEDKGNRLVTYAAKCIDNEILMVLRTEKKHSRETSIYEPLGTDSEGNYISLMDIIESEDEDMAERLELEENVRKLKKVLKSALKERERQIIGLRYGLYGGKEVTQREVAKIFNISRSYVSRIEKKALAKLREEYEKE
ncbi:MAG: RNA polymerase sporulation sigma factor SigK [Lachnospiraceae bacterium]|nr:RNA polymerase sporulation sigma factor SigK [Lachnospiraceae bacterium]